MNTKPVFHGSDIEKICEYYHLNQEDIVNFGANVRRRSISDRRMADDEGLFGLHMIRKSNFRQGATDRENLHLK